MNYMESLLKIKKFFLWKSGNMYSKHSGNAERDTAGLQTLPYLFRWVNGENFNRSRNIFYGAYPFCRKYGADPRPLPRLRKRIPSSVCLLQSKSHRGWADNAHKGTSNISSCAAFREPPRDF